MKILVFAMQLDRSWDLNKGRLTLIDTEGGILGRWVATSGLGAHQNVGGWSKQGGGVIPATYQCNPTFDNYWVDTKPLDRSSVKGIEGMAYPITPFEVRTKEGVTRSDLMVHLDANVPGSMGCVAIVGKDEYEDFCKVFERECSDVDKVKLFVIYTY
jgi:hypothetical protein